MSKRVAVKQPATRHRKLQHGASECTTSDDSLYILKPVTKELSFLRVSGLQARENKLSTEEEQLKAIADLYPSIAKLQGFKAPEIKGDEHPSEILTSLLKTMEMLERPEEWSVEIENDIYTIQSLHEYGDGNACFIPVDFLCQLQDTQPRLFEYLCYAFTLIARNNGIDLFRDWVRTNQFTGMYYEYLLERIDFEDDVDDEGQALETPDSDTRKALEYYGPGGLPCQMYKLLRGLNPSLKIFKQQIESFVPRNELEEISLKFLQLTSKLAATEKDIRNYCLDVHEQGILTPVGYKQVAWTVDTNDRMYMMFAEWMDDLANNIGTEGFMWRGKLGDNNNTEHENFIDLLNEWFDEGREMAHQLKEKLKN